MSVPTPAPGYGTSEVARPTSASRATEGDNSLTPSLTTTFTPPSECTQGHLTMLERQAYYVWLNAPLPVVNTTFSSCYPDAFMTSYLQSAVSGTIAGPFSPLVCPKNYVTVRSQSVSDRPSYIVCCPSGYNLATATSAPSDRPGFSGTCYRDIISTTVTQYDNSSLIGTITFSTSGQAYAHPLDGFAMERPATTQTSPTRSPTSNPTSTSISASSPSATGGSTNQLSPGAIAGIVIGAVGGLAILAGLAFFFFRSRRRFGAHNEEKAAEQYSQPMFQPWAHGELSSDAKYVQPHHIGETESVEMPPNQVHELPNTLR